MNSSAIFDLYVQLAPAELFRLLQRQMGVIVRNGIYSARLVMWMMIHQRLQAGGSLASSVEQLVQGRFDSLLSRCKRVQEKKIALSTGGYCQARQHLPKLLMGRSMDELIERLRNRLLESGPRLVQRVYLLDGSSLQLEHEPELVEAYPPASNQHGKSHWPVIRIVVLHDLETGLAERPYWGPLNGRHAVGEQALAEHAMRHLPVGSVIVGDRNFGIFSTVYNAQQLGLAVVVRLTAERAQSKSLMGGPISRAGEYPVCWRPSRWDGKGRGPWPADACVEGRLIVRRVGRGKHKQWLYLFTPSPLPAEQVVELYGRRWNIETDLRSLKQTVRLQRIAARSTDRMEKELLAAVMAYNLVRAINVPGCAASQNRCATVELHLRLQHCARWLTPRFWPPVGPNDGSRNSQVSLTWWPDVGFPSARNAARFYKRCGAVAIVFQSDEGRKTKWHCARVRAPQRPARGWDWLFPDDRRLNGARLMRPARQTTHNGRGGKGCCRTDRYLAPL